ncbi:MAG: LCP family protein [Treponema sp.]|nr:LCP family protein [Treponema sp.]
MRKLKNEQKGLLFVISIIIIAVLLTIYFAIYLQSDAVEDYLQENSLLKTLFIVEDEDDSVLFSNVLVYNKESQKGALINIPGYTGAIYRTLGRTDRIDAVYEEVDVQSFKSEIESLLGIKIPFYVIIGFNDFIKLSDYLGGIRVFVSEPIDMVSESGERFLLPSGSINLDGDKITSYLHYKHEEETESDVQDRYQNVMQSFFTRLHEKKYEIFMKKNYKIFKTCLKSNLDDDDEKTLLKLISEMDAESSIRQTITGSLRNVGKQQLLMPDNNGEFIKEAVRQTTNLLATTEDGMSGRVYVLEIQNGTTVQGLARNTALLYQRAAYDVLSPVNADRNDYAQTVIVDHIGNKEVANLIGEFIHCTNIVDEEEAYSSGANVDFTIILGQDFNGRYVVK